MDTQVGRHQLVEEMLTHLKPPVPVMDRDKDSKVAAFYANRSVFVTGGTGFIGKALIEKLIRSCPSVKRIYVLVREKRGKSAHQRLTELIKSQYFDRIRQAHEGSSRVLEEKLHAICGDITQPKFGIAPEDMQLLSDECSVVINSAATIRFVEPIDNAVRNNIYSVGQLVEFCDELAHLEALIHLSTAYSNCHKRDTIDEIFYEPPMRGDKILDTVESLSKIQSQVHIYPKLINIRGSERLTNIGESYRDACEPQRFYNDLPKFATSSKADNATGGSDNNRHVTELATYHLLEGFTRIALRRSNRPNTYTFTKAISESYLLEKIRARPDRYLNDKIPVAIVRPSIVGAAWREPVVGWMDNLNGPAGGLLAMYVGALQAMPGDDSLICDMVPIDMVASMVLCTGQFLVEQLHANKKTNERRSSASRIKHDQGVYLFNLVSGARNPVYWRRGLATASELAYKYPTKYMVRLPSSHSIRAGKLYDWFDLINHKLPAYLMDLIESKFWCQPLDRRSSSMMTYRRIKNAMDIVTPFTSNQWKFSDHNTQALYESLEAADKRVFPFNVALIDWVEYSRAYIIGARVYLLRDEPESVPAAMRQLRQRQALYRMTMGSLMVLGFFILAFRLF